MWNPAVGINELALLLLVACVLPLVLSRGTRWLVGILPCLAVGALVSPADPVSMLIVGVPLVCAFVLGVYCSRFIRPANGV